MPSKEFAADAFIFGLIGLAFLSWTGSVDLFRLGLSSYYEHMIAYALFGLVIMASKGKASISELEFIILIVISAFLEATKFYISFRHPKVADFYADLIGIVLSVGSGFTIRIILRFINLIRYMRIKQRY